VNARENRSVRGAEPMPNGDADACSRGAADRIDVARGMIRPRVSTPAGLGANTSKLSMTPRLFASSQVSSDRSGSSG